MKDAKHHLKHVQKKVIKSIKKKNPSIAQPTRSLGDFSEFKRPKTIPNKRKIA